MMAFRGRSRKPEEDMQLFAYNLEALLSRAMPNIEAGDRNTLLKQQFIEGVASTLKKELLQRPNLSYEDTVSIAQQLDLASHISSKQIEGQVNHASSNNPKPPIDQPPFVAQLVENMEVLRERFINWQSPSLKLTSRRREALLKGDVGLVLAVVIKAI